MDPYVIIMGPKVSAGLSDPSYFLSEIFTALQSNKSVRL
jgi:hypothetical protein